MDPCHLSYIQKCNFKECPLTWVAPLTMILPIKNNVQELYLSANIINLSDDSARALKTFWNNKDNCGKFSQM
jgi:hypothetical protein